MRRDTRVAVAYKVQAQQPDAWLHVLADMKHALPSEAPRRCAREIRAFLGGADESYLRGPSPGLVRAGVDE